MKKTANFIFLITLALSVSTPVFGQVGPSAYDPDILLIKFEPSVTQFQIDRFKQEYGAIELDISPVSFVRKWRIMSFPTPAPNHFIEINEVIQHANSQAEVTGSGLNYHVALSPSYNVTNNTSAGTCGYSLDCITGTTPIKIAIFDTGVAYSCPEFTPYFNPVKPGYDFVNNDYDPMDDHGHGSHIAGIIRQVVKPHDAQNFLMVAYKTHNQEGNAELFAIIRAVDRAILENIQILNMSFCYYSSNGIIAGAYEPPSNNNVGGPGVFFAPKKAPLKIAIDIAGERGILVVASAGNRHQNNDNNARPAYPASFSSPNILSVASADCQHKLSGFSNWGHQQVDIAAPGELITSATLNCETTERSGTSQSAAFVSGVSMLVSTHFNVGQFSYARVKCAILYGAEPSSFLSTKVNSGGVVHAPDALKTFLMNQCLSESVELRSAEELPTNDSFDWSLSPNPFSSTLHLQFEAPAGNASINIYDARGMLVWTKNWTADQYSDKMSFDWTPDGSSPGVYYIQLNTPGKTSVSKAVFMP